jgi:hypothetical protein
MLAERFAALVLALFLAMGLVVSPAAAAAQTVGDAPLSAGEAAYDLRQLIGRYVAWRGPAFGVLQSLHERFYVETPDGRRMGALWMDRDGRTRRETVIAGAREVEVASPETAWRSGPDGKPSESPGAAERARRYALLEFGDAFTGRGGASVALAGTADAQDHTWAVVRVSFGDADVYEALIDSAAGALCCYRITENGRTRTVLFGDWRLVDGVRLPFARLVQAEAQSGERVTSAELNVTLDPSLFQRPAG